MRATDQDPLNLCCSHLSRYFRTRCEKFSSASHHNVFTVVFFLFSCPGRNNKVGMCRHFCVPLAPNAARMFKNDAIIQGVQIRRSERVSS